MKRLFCLLVALSWLALFSHLILAQVTTAAISGAIKDETGAALPGVSLAIRNLDTGIARTLITDDQGRYHAPNLGLGDYEVQAELAGFQTEVRRGIKLTVGRQAVVDFTLKVGEITEQVLVTGEAPLVDSAKDLPYAAQSGHLESLKESRNASVTRGTRTLNHENSEPRA